MDSRISVEHRLATLETEHKAYNDQKKDHELRIRHLERWVWAAIGALAVVQLLPTILDFIKS